MAASLKNQNNYIKIWSPIQTVNDTIVTVKMSNLNSNEENTQQLQRIRCVPDLL
jgi:hypothetical protein